MVLDPVVDDGPHRPVPAGLEVDASFVGPSERVHGGGGGVRSVGWRTLAYEREELEGSVPIMDVEVEWGAGVLGARRVEEGARRGEGELSVR